MNQAQLRLLCYKIEYNMTSPANSRKKKDIKIHSRLFYTRFWGISILFMNIEYQIFAGVGTFLHIRLHGHVNQIAATEEIQSNDIGLQAPHTAQPFGDISIDRIRTFSGRWQ